jgi:hypothetical protein
MPIHTRRINENDEPLVTRWLEADEVHKRLGLKFTNLLAPNTEAYLISDEGHTPVMAVRLHKALRVAIQFGDSPYRSARHAKEVVSWFTEQARQDECREVIIRPGGGAVQFADKLGFTDFAGKYIEVI